MDSDEVADDGSAEADAEDDQVEAEGDADDGAFDGGVGPEAEPAGDDVAAAGSDDATAAGFSEQLSAAAAAAADGDDDGAGFTAGDLSSHDTAALDDDADDPAAAYMMQVSLLPRDAQAKLALIVAQCLSIHLCVCLRQLESCVCTQHCASRATSTTGLSVCLSLYLSLCVILYVWLSAGLLQVREKWKKVGRFEWSGKGRGGNIFFGKVRENEKLVPPDVSFSG